MYSNKIMFIVMRQSSFYSFFPLDRYNNIEKMFYRTGSLKEIIDYKFLHKKENFLSNNSHDIFRYYSNQLDVALKILKNNK